MKKTIAVIISMFLAVGISGCGEKSVIDNKETTTETKTEATTETTTEATTEAEVVDYEITYQNLELLEHSSGTKLQIIVEVENTGTQDLHLSSSAELEDADGNLVGVIDGLSIYPDIIAPGEKGYLYEEAILDNYTGELNLVLRPSIEESTKDIVRYEVADVSLSENMWGKVSALGRVTNTSDEVATLSYIKIIYFDENHIPIGCDSTTITSDLEPNETIGFEIGGATLPDFVNLENVADYVIYAHPMQYQ